MTDILVTAAEGADEVGVSRNTIYSWVDRGILTHVERRGHLKLFRLSEVFAAEATRDRRKRRHTPPW